MSIDQLLARSTATSCSAYSCSNGTDREWIALTLEASARGMKGYGVSIESLNYDMTGRCWSSLFPRSPRTDRHRRAPRQGHRRHRRRHQPRPPPDRAPPRVPHAPHRRRGHRQARRARSGRQSAGRSPSVRLLELDNNHTNATKCNRMQHCSKFSSGHAAIVACSAPHRPPPISKAAAGLPEDAV